MGTPSSPMILVGAVLSLLVISYLIADNPIYRVLLSAFVGTLVGFSAAMALRFILLRAIVPLMAGQMAMVFPLILGILLLYKFYHKYTFVGNLSTAYLVGVGAALALGGALTGTLLPQLRGAIVEGLGIAIGTVCTLFAFHYGLQGKDGRPSPISRILGPVTAIGRLLIAIALGVAFAGALTASLSILVNRVTLILETLGTFIGI